MIDAIYRDDLFYSYQYLCRRGARKFLRPGLERSDLEQVAALGLIKACRRYDQRSGTPFEAFAWLMVVGELMHHVRDYERPMRFPRRLRQMEKQRARAHEGLLGRLGREPTDGELAAEMGVTVGDIGELQRASTAATTSPLEEERDRDRSSAFAQAVGVSIDDRLALEQGLRSLPEVQRLILVGIYRLGLTQAEVAHSVSLSPRHVSRLHRKALDSMHAYWTRGASSRRAEA